MNPPWQMVSPLAPDVFTEVRREAIFQCCKWDPQVEDVSTLSPLPLVLTRPAWAELVAAAEALAQETIAAELVLLQNSRWLKTLGLSWALRRGLMAPETAAGLSRHLHLVRFDFHFTPEGWRISEANSDVPGGFNEASGFTRLMAEYYPGTKVSGDPTRAIVAAIRNAMGHSGTVALVHATAFADDRQVMEYLARALQEQGCRALLVAPDHLRWSEGQARGPGPEGNVPVDFVFRFFPAEWLPNLSRKSGWKQLLGAATTPLCNPGAAIVTQSKRFPLVWDELPVELSAWRKFLPRTLEVPAARTNGHTPETLVFKPAFGRVGDMIKMSGVTSEREARKIDRSMRWHPQQWIAQERFEAVPLCSPSGDLFPCVGVYTLNGRVIGAYGRMARRPLIDHLAQDTAILIME